MPYLGNPAQQRFSSPRAASVYSGDGSTVAFTLEEVVSTDEDVLVSVDGVIQEPSVAYAVSSGTTLTFTAAPSSNAGNNIFVYYIARTFGSVSMPDGQNVNAATGSFSGDVTIGDASAADKKILFDGNAQDYHIGLDDSTDSLTIGKGSTLGTTTSMAIDANGIITKPLQPAFLVQATAASNLGLNADHTIAFGSAVFDNNADFDLGNNRFVAPVTGRYQFNLSVRLDNLDDATAYYMVKISTSNRDIQTIHGNSGYDADVTYMSLTLPVLVDMDAGDTSNAIIGIPSTGSAQVDLHNVTRFSGYLVA